ncbi:MAG: hypothetical protein ACJAY7_001205 [Pseudohongiellaceae bacterium]
MANLVRNVRQTSIIQESKKIIERDTGMKTTTLKNGMLAAAVLATLLVAALLVFQAQFFNFDVLSGSSDARLTSGQEEGVIAQVESIFSTSARYVFDRDYWIANMHNIRNPRF